MITLTNGAEVHAAYVLPAGAGMKPNGLVLAETDTDWVVWNIYWDGELQKPDDVSETQSPGELWECETGSYFQKACPPSMGDPKKLAELAFGLKLRRLLTEQMAAGVREIPR